MRRIFSACCASVAIASVFAISSCEKESRNLKRSPGVGSQIATLSVDEAKAMTSRLQGFYRDMKSYKSGNAARKTAHTVSYSVDSANFLIEGTYNMLAVHQDNEANEQTVTFDIVEVLDNDGLLPEASVGNAFWRVKDSLMVLYNSLSYTGKELTFLDIDATTSGNTVTFKGTGKISSGKFVSCTQTLSQRYGPNRAFSIRPLGGYIYIQSANGSQYRYGAGQGDFSGITVINEVTTTAYPNASQLIRQYGINNYLGCQAQPCGYHVNVTTKYFVPTGSYPNNQVLNPGNVDFGFSDQWATRIDYDGAYLTASVWDSLYDAKMWLRTNVMDWYISRVPSTINANMGPGRSFYEG